MSKKMPDKIQASVALVLRALFYGTWLFTSVYCLLAYVPFTFRQVLSINLVPGLSHLAGLQPLLSFVFSALLFGFVFIVEKKKRISPEDTRELIALTILILGSAIYDVPKHLVNSGSSLVWSFVSLLPVFWFSFFDLRDVGPHADKPPATEKLIICALISSGFATLIYWATYGGSLKEELLIVAGANVVISAFLCISEILSSYVSMSLQAKFRTYSLLIMVSLGLFIYSKFCTSIAFFGPLAFAWSFAFSAAVGFVIAAVAGARQKRDPHFLSTAFHAYVSNLAPFGRGLYGNLGTLFILFLIPIFARAVFTAFDWNGLLQQTVALIICFSFFSQIYNLSDQLPQKFSIPRPRLQVIQAVVAFGLLGVVFLKSDTLKATNTVNPLSTISKEFLFPAKNDLALFRFLQSKTNLPKDFKITLPLQETPAAVREVVNKPYVFIFVIDSLRRDYISAYNPKVTFTPEIGKLASEFHVFKNAFTRYGATGLSEPSIWAGQMFPHQMYPQPFSSINLLEKLIEAEDYRAWVSRDSILQEILAPSEKFDDLDKGVGTQDLDFCSTSKEVISRLSAPQDRPIFVYSQSQNLHVSVLARTSTEKADDQFAGFHAPVAQALMRIDNCFGQFVADLKRIGIYDKSLIVLTSDHGDSLGEEGRYGHAYTIYPEIVRIPLLIHIPSDLTATPIDKNSVVFSTDIAPTVSFALGRDVSRKHWSQGSSLFFFDQAPATLEEEHLVISSYGPVAGILSENGKMIHIADAINFANYSYSLDELGSSNAGVTPKRNSDNETLIKEKFDQLHTAFGL